MEFILVFALTVSALIYLYIGYSLGNKNNNIGDLLPIVFGRNAKVNDVDEFSSSTAATTISLATVVLAYFELAGVFGTWLIWTAITTGLGMWLIGLVAQRIWKRMSYYNHRPSLHEFLGVEFSSPNMALVASFSTSVGYLLIFATELIVGSRFLASLVPSIPEWATVVFLSSVGFLYTLIGGFRAVIKTDQLQMRFIWALISILVIYYIYHIVTNGGWQVAWAKVPNGTFDFGWQAGLGFFLLGIAVMNIPLQISSMSVWQRISGAHEVETVVKGIRSSIWVVTLSWTLLALLACGAFLIVTPNSNQTLLSDLLATIGSSAIGKAALFVITLGLYGAMLSTASTNLIVVTHTVSEDIFAKFKTSTLEERIDSRKEFITSRLILFGSALLAIFLVEGLKIFGFSIADLAFSIYGASLALFPPVLIALYNDRNVLKKLSQFATWAVILGFLSGWGAAIYGKYIGDGNLIFLSPAFSILVSFLVLGLGYFIRKKE